MKYYAQKPEKMWWTHSSNSVLYAVREYSAIPIATWALFTILFYLFPQSFSSLTKTIINVTGLIGALAHTITWLQVMPKLLPFTITKTVSRIIFGILIVIWLFLSDLIFLWQ